MSLKTSTRINKYISESGLCSRREADRFVEQGNVYINGRRATTGDQVVPGDRVKVNGQEIEPQEEEDLVLIALNKPVGIVSTTESSEKANIVDFVGHGVRIFPIGRLDKDSQGLILLTNNGDLVNKILRANNNHEKEYVVTVNKPVTDEFVSGMQAGVPILGQVTKKCKVEKVSTFAFNITLVQGLNRQIRRMCEYFGFEVVELVRTRIMNVSLKGLALGDWRDLTPREIDTIVALTEGSEAAPPPPAQKPKPRARKGASSKAGAPPKGRSGTAHKAKPAGRGKPGNGKPAPKGAGKPPAKGKPAAQGKRAGKPAGKPINKTAGKPSAKNGGKPAGKGRAASAKPARGKGKR
ncbi:23S rRNA pseudouridine(2604) synthase RluF [Halomonas sp. PAMB 3264]|uniref:23S rRNA pseudouridine(2604) synthase RluF n=1 Tax=Halomonas sp. PAMB 3264 TaxID=3075222 RepID=UPI00289892CD|nr:23S rRNA pseudouridine(2604) synthase RluF [Halomonas sp. PAMB 3264]WNL40780.1 23S rRNA pseudouridine(2604) synthase RluF [Halomonas sp. PAMB 3264]